MSAFEAFQSLNRTVYRSTLPNGIRVLVTPNPAADIVSSRLFFQGGQRLEALQQAGLTHLLAAVLTKGTDRRSSLDIADVVESMGGGLSTDFSADHFQISTKSISADFSQVFALAAEILRSPSFPESEIELERKLTLQAIRSQQEQPFSIAFDKLRHAFYGAHPYADSGLGTLETVPTLTRSDLVAYHRQVFRPENLVISLAGRITPEIAAAEIDRVLGDWTAGKSDFVEPVLPPVPSLPVRVLTPQATAQAIVMVGHLANAIKQDAENLAEYAALKLINTYLGSGLSSRLFVELREKRGLAYEVSAFYPMRLDTSHFVAYMGTAPHNTQTAIDGLSSELDRLTHTLLSEQELQISKDKFLGQYALSKQTNAQLAQTFGWYEMLGLGLSYDRQLQEAIESISIEAIQAAAQKTFRSPYISVLGPEEVLSQLADHG